MPANSRTIARSSFWENLFKTPTAKNDLEHVLMSMPPFRQFNSKHLNDFLKIIHNRVYATGEYIFHQDDPGIALYIIIEGEVVISETFSDGENYDLALLTKGDFFGEIALMDNGVRSASAIATRQSSLAVIFRPDMDEFVDKYPKKGVEILTGISQILATRLRAINKDYIVLLKDRIKGGF
jgi:CRP/FNR family transcriptional regulator, cyclic AMP receptor protein